MKTMSKRELLITAACGCMFFTSVGLTSGITSTYLPYFMSVADITRTMGGLIFTFRGLFSFISLLALGSIYRKIGIKNSMMFASLCGVIAFVLFAISHRYFVYIIAAAFAGFAHTMGGITSVSLMIERCFEKNRTTIIGISTACSGIAAIVMPPVFTLIANNISLTLAFLIESVLCLFSGIVAFLFLPKDVTQNKETCNKVTRPQMDFSLCCLMIATFASNLLIFGIINISAYLQESGMDSVLVAFLVSIYGVSMTASKIIHGRMADRMKVNKYILLTFPVGIIVSLLPIAIANTHNLPLAVADMILTGYSYAIAAVGVVALAKAYADDCTYPLILRYASMATALGTITGGFLIGKIADIAGSYSLAYIVLAFIGLLGTIAALLAVRKK